MTKQAKLGIELGLIGIIILLTFLVYNSVKTNIDFEKEKDRRIELTAKKLLNARELQFAFERKHRKYADNWDELITFALTDSLEFERRIGNLEDSAAVAQGLAYTETVFVPVMERLAQDGFYNPDIDINRLKYVPLSDSVFSISASSVIAGGVRLPTFEIGVDFTVLLEGLDAQLIQNARDNFETRTGFTGIRIGRIDQATTEGNW